MEQRHIRTVIEASQVLPFKSLTETEAIELLASPPAVFGDRSVCRLDMGRLTIGSDKTLADTDPLDMGTLCRKACRIRAGRPCRSGVVVRSRLLRRVVARFVAQPARERRPPGLPK